MASTVSLSKGCFVFKNGKRKPTSKHSKAEHSAKQVLLLCEGDKPLASEELRYRTYKELANVVEEEIKDLERTYHHQMFQQISGFVNRAGPLKRGIVEDVIPAAVLVTGINMPDHNRLFFMLSDHLAETCSPLIARLNSKQCSSVKSLIQNFVAQIMEEKEEVLSEPEEDEVESAKSTVKRSICSMSTLAAWYEEKYSSADENPMKKAKSSNPERNLVVVVFEDFEGFPVSVIEDSVRIFSNYRNRIPFVIVFGVAISASVIQDSLTYTVSSKIAIEKFQSQPSVHFLNSVLDKVIFSKKLPMKLGHRVFNLLMDLFLYHDFAVSNFINNIKFCMIEHYYSNPASSLCCNYEEAKRRIQAMKEKDLEIFRELPSYKTLSESKRGELVEQSAFKKFLDESVQKLQTYLSRFSAFVAALNKLVTGLPNGPLGKQFRETYILCFTSSVYETEAYKTVFQLLRLSSKDELKRRISEAVVGFNSVLSQEKATFHRIQDHMATYLYSLQSVGEAVPEEWKDREEPGPLELGKKMSKAELQERLMEAAKSKRRLSPFEQLRTEILDFLDAEFRKNLMPPTDLPFHEIFVFDALQSVKRQLVGAPRSALQVALTNPHMYLQCDCCRIEESSVVEKTMPDTCIAYKLHLECGKLINLYDWLQSFAAIVEPEDADDTVSKNTQARFSQSVSELQYIGFIKQSKRKVDHVARTTFGSA